MNKYLFERAKVRLFNENVKFGWEKCVVVRGS